MLSLHVIVASRRVNALAVRSFSISSFSTSHWNWNDTTSIAIKGRTDDALVTASVDPLLQTQILGKCELLHTSIMPLNEKIRGPLAKNSNQGTALPFVFLVGNHSSGKSSFINYILGRPVQVAGVAPTDDTFIVILPGPQDYDQDGPALI